MRRFTGWLALLIILGGLGYLIYEDMKLRRAGESDRSGASADAPTLSGGAVADAEPAPPPPPPAPAPVIASNDGATAVGAESEPSPARAAAGADTSGPAVESSRDQVAESSPTVPDPAAAADHVIVPDPEASGVTVAEEDDIVVAVAPEGSPADAGERSPVSESSDRRQPTVASNPPPADTQIAAVNPSAGVEPAAPVAEPAPVAPAGPVETAEEPAGVPTFDVVRVEPSGEAVMAGTAAPGGTVEIVSGDTTVATATASPQGDWAIALEEPLTAGQHDLAIRSTAPDGDSTMSEQRVAVVVPETEVEEPLVVLNTPDGPSTVLQVPTAPRVIADAGAPPAREQVSPAPLAVADATADSAAPASPSPVPSPSAAVEDSVAAGPPATTSTETETEAATTDDLTAAGGTDTAAATSDTVTPPVDAVSTPVSDGAPASADGDTVPEIAEASGDDADVISTPDAVVSAPETADATTAEGTAAADAVDAQDVAVEPAPAPEPAPVVPEVVVTAVEAETTGTLYVAGTTTTPEDVRVYMDGLLLGEARPSPSGTWLLTVERELPAGTYDVRADQVEGGSGTVIARAEVPFERELDVAILTPVAEAGGASGAVATGTLSGPTTMIIKRRDNLWRISRQLYGKGVRWSTIYQANKDQIRNPHWIYPGQVFVLPEGSLEWAGEDAPKSTTN